MRMQRGKSSCDIGRKLRTFAICFALVIANTSCSVSRHELADPGQFDFPLNQNIGTVGSQADLRWREAQRVCMTRISALQREVDGLNRKHSRLRAVWTGIGAVLGFGSTVYSVADASPDPTTVSVLSLVAAAATIPSFFLDPGRERIAVINSKVGGISEARSAVVQAVADASAGSQNFASTCRELLARGAPLSAFARAACTVPTAPPYEPTTEKIDFSELIDRASVARGDYEAAHARLEAALERMLLACIS